MEKFKKIKEQIGKAGKLKIQNYTTNEIDEINLNWETIFCFTDFRYVVSEEYRKNIISKSYAPYTLLIGENMEIKIYPNVNDYIMYIGKILENTTNLCRFDLIYVWDNPNNKLIEIWECDSDNRYMKINKTFVENVFPVDFQKKIWAQGVLSF